MTLQHARLEMMHDLATVPSEERGAGGFDRPPVRGTRQERRAAPALHAQVTFYRRRPTRLLPTGLW